MSKPLREDSYRDVIKSIADYDDKYLNYIKHARARLDLRGWLDQDEVESLTSSTEDLVRRHIKWLRLKLAP